MDLESFVLSNSELTTVIGALLEPHKNPEIGQAWLLIALKLLGNSISGPSSVNISVLGHFSKTAAASQAQVHWIFFTFCWYVNYPTLGHTLRAF